MGQRGRRVGDTCTLNASSEFYYLSILLIYQFGYPNTRVQVSCKYSLEIGATRQYRNTFERKPRLHQYGRALIKRLPGARC